MPYNLDQDYIGIFSKTRGSTPEGILIREVLMTFAADIRLARARYLKGLISRRKMEETIHSLMEIAASSWVEFLCDLCGSNHMGLLRALSLLASCDNEALKRLRLDQFTVVAREYPSKKSSEDDE